jgi:hypothetical protein
MDLHPESSSYFKSWTISSFKTIVHESGFAKDSKAF